MLVLLQVRKNAQLVTTGGSCGAWQNLLLYLTARFFGHELAAQTSKVYLIDSHENDQTLYTNFDDTRLLELFAWSAEEFPKHTKDRPVRRIGYACWLRNIPRN